MPDGEQDAVGATLKPRVFCVGELADQGAGHPDFGLYTARQVQRGRPRTGPPDKKKWEEVKKEARPPAHGATTFDVTAPE